MGPPVALGDARPLPGRMVQALLIRRDLEAGAEDLNETGPGKISVCGKYLLSGYLHVVLVGQSYNLLELGRFRLAGR